MKADKKLIVEEVLKLEVLAAAEKTQELRVRRIATWDTPEVEYAYQNIDTLDTIAFFFPDMQNGVEEWVRGALNVLSSYDSCITCFPSDSLAHANFYCDYFKFKISRLKRYSLGTNSSLLCSSYIIFKKAYL